MPQIAFLNERSHPTGEIRRDIAVGLIDKFLDLVIQLRKVLPRVSLIAEMPILLFPIGDSYSVGQWLNEAERERRRLMIAIANVAPFQRARDLYGDADPGVSEYQFAGDPFDGLVLEGIGLADMYGGLAVSFSADERWRIRLVPVRVRRLLDHEEVTSTTEVRHGVSGGPARFGAPRISAGGRVVTQNE